MSSDSYMPSTSAREQGIREGARRRLPGRGKMQARPGLSFL